MKNNVINVCFVLVIALYLISAVDLLFKLELLPKFSLIYFCVCSVMACSRIIYYMYKMNMFNTYDE
jgi:hypothetical protein